MFRGHALDAVTTRLTHSIPARGQSPMPRNENDRVTRLTERVSALERRFAELEGGAIEPERPSARVPHQWDDGLLVDEEQPPADPFDHAHTTGALGDARGVDL